MKKVVLIDVQETYIDVFKKKGKFNPIIANLEMK